GARSTVAVADGRAAASSGEAVGRLVEFARIIPPPINATARTPTTPAVTRPIRGDIRLRTLPASTGATIVSPAPTVGIIIVTASAATGAGSAAAAAAATAATGGASSVE